jgi:rod shape-determining protein MreB and related proteins
LGGVLGRRSFQRSRELAIDLGTANTLVFVRGEGIVVFEPSVVAIDEATGRVHAVGEDARRMIGRTPASIRAIRPLRHGVIADFDITAEMLRYFIRRAAGGGLSFSRVVLCVPSGITDVERNAVEEATLAAGARQVSLIEEPMAAAIGAGLPVAEAQGSMVVDIGGGTTEVAVMSLGGIVVWESVRVGGYELDDAIVRHVDANAHLLIGSETAEAAKIACGAAWPIDETIETDVAGRDRITGLLRRTTIDSGEVRAAIAQPLETIVDTARRTLEVTPPELAADVANNGIVLAGGGALLRGIDRLLSSETGLPVLIAESPLECVVLGAGSSLEESDVTGRAVRRGGPFRKRRRRR